MTDRLKDLLNLLKRSNADGDGWYSVSRVVMPLVRAFPADIAIVDENADGSGRVRLTDGKAQRMSDSMNAGIARAIVEAAGKTGKFNSYSGLDPEYLRREIEAALFMAYARGMKDAADQVARVTMNVGSL